MRKADVGSPAVLWIGVLLVALIGGVWLLRVIPTSQTNDEAVREDLTRMRAAVTRACGSVYFNMTYNPHVEEGFLRTNLTQLCINASGWTRCVQLSCPAQPATLDLAEITTLTVLKNDSVWVVG